MMGGVLFLLVGERGLRFWLSHRFFFHLRSRVSVEEEGGALRKEMCYWHLRR